MFNKIKELFILKQQNSKKQGGLNLLGSVGRWRVQPRYWLIAWLGPLFIFGIGLGIYLIFGGAGQFTSALTAIVNTSQPHL